MKFKPRPILLIALVILLGYFLPNMGSFFLMRTLGGKSIFYYGAVVSSLSSIGTSAGVCWVAYRRGQTSLATYLVPMVLLCIPTVFIALTGGRPIEYVHDVGWQSLKQLILQWIGCYFLSKSFVLYLIRNDCDETQMASDVDRGISIRFFLVAIAIIAVMLVGDRWIARPSMSLNVGDLPSLMLFVLIWPMSQSLILFGVGYFLATHGKRKLVGLGAIGLYLICTAIWFTWFMIFYYPKLLQNLPIRQSDYLITFVLSLCSPILTHTSIVGILALSGYRFATIERKQQALPHDDASFDSILANEPGLPP